MLSLIPPGAFFPYPFFFMIVVFLPVCWLMISCGLLPWFKCVVALETSSHCQEASVWYGAAPRSAQPQSCPIEAWSYDFSDFLQWHLTAINQLTATLWAPRQPLSKYFWCCLDIMLSLPQHFNFWYYVKYMERKEKKTLVIVWTGESRTIYKIVKGTPKILRLIICILI